MEEEYKKAIPSPANWKEDGRDYFSVIELIWNYRTEFSSVDEDLMDEKMNEVREKHKVVLKIHGTNYAMRTMHTDEEVGRIVDYLNEKYPVEVDVKLGMQPVYSYIIGVE